MVVHTRGMIFQNPPRLSIIQQQQNNHKGFSSTASLHKERWTPKMVTAVDLSGRRRPALPPAPVPMSHLVDRLRLLLLLFLPRPAPRPPPPLLLQQMQMRCNRHQLPTRRRLPPLPPARRQLHPWFLLLHNLHHLSLKLLQQKPPPLWFLLHHPSSNLPLLLLMIMIMTMIKPNNNKWVSWNHGLPIWKNLFVPIPAKTPSRRPFKPNWIA
mmetsp:Transcript_36028/g.87067  ORF Transcript_36028/g.87067 Transcript_36028/m.87067 type:complete len:211 (+) Transcript_36028:1521-2153(+)